MSKDGAPSVCVIILNWNGWEDTVECLESLRDLDYANYQVVVLDNGSEDDSFMRIQSWAKGKTSVESSHVRRYEDNGLVSVVTYDRTTAEAGGVHEAEQALMSLPAARRLVLVKIGENLGYAAGCNVGIRYALATGADYVWLLNNDTVVAPSSLSALVCFLENFPDYQGVTGQIRFYDNPLMVWNCGGSLTWYGSRRYHYAGAPIAKTPQQGFRRISFITGCSALFRAALFREVGLLSEAFFFGEEDFELSKRLQRFGCKLACKYDAIIYHKVGVSINTAARGRLIGKIYIYYLNRFIDMRRYWPSLVWRVWRLLYSLYILPMLKLRHGLRWHDIWQLLNLLFRDSMTLDRVDKKVFEWAMNLELGKVHN